MKSWYVSVLDTDYSGFVLGKKGGRRNELKGGLSEMSVSGNGHFDPSLNFFLSFFLFSGSFYASPPPS